MRDLRTHEVMIIETKVKRARRDSNKNVFSLEAKLLAGMYPPPQAALIRSR